MCGACAVKSLLFEAWSGAARAPAGRAKKRSLRTETKKKKQKRYNKTKSTKHLKADSVPTVKAERVPLTDSTRVARLRVSPPILTIPRFLCWCPAGTLTLQKKNPTENRKNAKTSIYCLRVVLRNTWCSRLRTRGLRVLSSKGTAAADYDRSPRMRRASWMSLGMIVTRLAWMAQRLVSSKRLTM